MAISPEHGNPASARVATGWLDEELDRFRRRVVRRDLIARLIELLGLAALFPLVVVAIDHALSGGLSANVIRGAAIAWGALSAGAVLALLAILLGRRVGSAFIARQVEREFGIRHNTLVNALLLRKAPRAAYALNAAERRATADLAAGEVKAAHRIAISRGSLLLPVVALAAWVVFAAVSPKSVAPSLARFFGATVAAPTATTLAWLRPTADDVIHAAEPLRIDVRTGGRAIDSVSFQLLPHPPATGAALAPIAARVYPMRREAAPAGDRWTLTLAPHEVTGDIRYCCNAGDARLEGVLQVLPQPDLEEIRIEVQAPQYMRLPVRTADDPDLVLWSGSRVTFTTRANVAQSLPVFVFESETETRTRMNSDDDDPRAAAVSLPITSEGRYRFEFADTTGYAWRNPPTHHVTIRHDAVPRAEIVWPSPAQVPDGRVDVLECPRLLLQASDDFGLVDLQLIREVDGATVRLPLHDASADSPTVPMREWHGSVETDPLLPAGASDARVWIEVRDNRMRLDGSAAAQLGQSRVLTLHRSAPEQQPQREAGSSTATRDPQSDEETPDSARGAAAENAPPAAVESDQASAGAEPDQASTADDPQQDPAATNEHERPAAPPQEPPRDNAEETSERQPESQVSEQPPSESQDTEQAHPGDSQPSDSEGRGEAQDGESARGSGLDDPGPDARDAGQSEPGAESGPDDSNGRGGTNEGPRNDGGGALDDEVRRFAEEHAKEVRELRRRLDERARAGGQGGADEPGTGNDSSSRPGSEPRGRAEEPPPARPDQSNGTPENQAQTQRGSDDSSGNRDSGQNGGDRSAASGTGAEGGPQPDDAAPPAPGETASADEQSNSSAGAPGTEDAVSSDGKTEGGQESGGTSSPSDDNKRVEPEGGAAAETGGNTGSSAGDSGSSSGGEAEGPASESGKPGSPESGGAVAERQSGEASATAANGSADSGGEESASEKDGTTGGRGQPESQEQAGQPKSGSSALGTTGEGTAGGTDRQGTADGAASGAGDRTDSGEAGGRPRLSAGDVGGGDADGAVEEGPLDPAAAQEPGQREARGEGASRLDSDGRSELNDLLELMNRADELEETLGEMGWPPEKRSAFVRELKRLQQRMSDAGDFNDRRRVRHDPRLGEAGVQAGRGLAGEARAQTGDIGARESGLDRIAPPAEQKVAPELRQVLEAYYRSLAQRRSRDAAAGSSVQP